jgi:3-isopropylmalate/(R)-2-methylmalate dehydratase small subunit
VEENEGARLTVDLDVQEVRAADGSRYVFSGIDPFRKQCLMNGWDEIELTLQHEREIRAFEARHESAHPFLFPQG